MKEMEELAVSFFKEIKILIKELRKNEKALQSENALEDKKIVGENSEEVNLIDGQRLMESVEENGVLLTIEAIDKKTEEFINTYTKKCTDEIESRKNRLVEIKNERIKIEENLYEYISPETSGIDDFEVEEIDKLNEEENNISNELEEYEKELADFNEIMGNMDLSDHSYIDKLELMVDKIEQKNDEQVINYENEGNPNIANSQAEKELEEFFEEMQEYCEIPEELKNICRKNPEFANFMFETGDYKEEVLAQSKVNTHEYNEMVNKINEIIEAKKLKDFYEKIEKYYKGFPEEFYKLKELLFQEPRYANAMIDGRDEFYEGVLLSNYYGKPEYDTMRKIINKLIKIGKELQKQGEKPAIAEQGAKTARPEQGSKPARPEQGSKPARPEQGSKPARPEQGSKPAIAEQGSKPAIAEQGAKTARPEQGSKPARPEQGSKPARPEQGSKPAIAEQGSKPAIAEQGAKTARPEQGAKTARPEQGAKPVKPEQGSKPGQENEEIHIKSIVLGRKIGIVYDSETTRWNTTLEFSRVKRNLNMTDIDKIDMIEQIMGLPMEWKSENRPILLQKIDPNFLDALLVAQSNGVNKKEINKIFTNYMLGLAGEKKSQDNIRNVLFYNRNGMEHSKIFTRFIRRNEYNKITYYSIMAEDICETVPDKKKGFFPRLWQSLRTKRLEAKNEKSMYEENTLNNWKVDEETRTKLQQVEKEFANSQYENKYGSVDMKRVDIKKQLQFSNKFEANCK